MMDKPRIILSRWPKGWICYLGSCEAHGRTLKSAYRNWQKAYKLMLERRAVAIKEAARRGKADAVRAKRLSEILPKLSLTGKPTEWH